MGVYIVVEEATNVYRVEADTEREAINEIITNRSAYTKVNTGLSVSAAFDVTEAEKRM